MEKKIKAFSFIDISTNSNKKNQTLDLIFMEKFNITETLN